MKKVYICSPYRPTGQNPEAERKRNVEKAQTACSLAIDVGSLGSDPLRFFSSSRKLMQTGCDIEKVIQCVVKPLAVGSVNVRRVTSLLG